MRIYTMASFSGVICKIVRLKHNSADICSQLSGQLLDYSECLRNFASSKVKIDWSCLRSPFAMHPFRVPFQGTDLERIWNGLETDLRLRQNVLYNK